MKQFLICAAALLTWMCATAESPRWLRNTAIAPDGSAIAFTYGGDIFIVPLAGGNARQLTTGSDYDTHPIWSPDSKKIVFSSDRDGSDDLYIVAAAGGNPTRLTTWSGNETPICFIDDKTVIYQTGEITSQQTSRMPYGMFKVYSVDTSDPGCRPKLFDVTPMYTVSIAADGRILYEDKKGYEDHFRKHERSSGTSDIWLIDNGTYTKLTDFNGNDFNPVWNPTGNGYYYISEQDGTLNVYAADLKGSARQLTHFEKHPVRSLSVAQNGTMAFSWDGDIYTFTEGSEPQKLDITILADQYINDTVKRFTDTGATTMAVSPKGNEVAFVIRGEVYVTDTKYETTKRITDTPAQERMVEFSPDGRMLVYDSDRDGKWQLFTAEIKNPAEKQFAYATEIVEKLLYSGDGVAQQPAFSPDGKKVAFLEDRTALKVIDLQTKQVTQVLDPKYNYSYTDGDISFEWSPDSRWLLVDYIGEGGWNNSDIAAVKADGSQVIDLTESGYTDSNAKWALGGKAVTYETGRYGMKSQGSWGNQSDIVLMVLDSETWDRFNASEEEAELLEKAEKDDDDSGDDDSAKGKKDKKDKKDKKGKKDKKADKEKPATPLDFANRRHRMTRLTRQSTMIGDYFLSPKGDKLYYTVPAPEGERNLYVSDLKKDETKVLAKHISGALIPDKDGENIFVLSRAGMKKIDLKGGDVEPIEFDAPYDRSRSAEREYIYDHMLRQVADKFYDKNLHGVDWEYYGEHYRQFLPYINNSVDFAELMSEILGELNASHTGARCTAGGASLNVASLGAFYDPDYDSDGLKVTEVISGSPLSTAKANVQPGDIILAINGKKIEAGRDYYPLLEGLANRKTGIQVLRTSGRTDTISIKPISNGKLTNLLYNRWIERNEAFVDSISGGRIAYVHISSMDGDSYSTVYDRLLGKYRNADAVVVDTRWNGGGWLHNDVAILLSGKRYVDFVPRGQYIGSEPFSQWTKPSVMLVGESNYSDAHGTPFAYQALKLGKVVGAPIPGTMTAVWWETQIDPSIFFGIPQVTSVDMQGNVLENHQLNPDIEVYNNPADEARGYDRQLETAVRALMGK